MKIAPGIDLIPVGNLRPHPENSLIFGSPEDSEDFDSLVASIKKHGQWDPIVATANGVILAGHRRHAALTELGAKAALVRFATCDSYRDELEHVIRSNTDRRHLTPREIALAFSRLKSTPKAEGGTKTGKGKRTDLTSASKSGGCEARDDAAEVLGVGRNEAEALEDVFTTPGVPEELKDAVNSGKVKPTPAAKAVRSEVKRQGGEVTSPDALKAFAETKAAPRSPRATHEDRVADGAAKFLKAQSKLLDVYRELDRALSMVPLKGVVGLTEHHEYGTLVRDIALRAWREIESVSGPTDAGKQMTLSVVKGGKA